MRCPNCKNRLLQKSEQGVQLRIAGKIWLEKSGCQAQCFWCKSQVHLPLHMDENVATRNQRVRLVVQEPKRS